MLHAHAQVKPYRNRFTFTACGPCPGHARAMPCHPSIRVHRCQRSSSRPDPGPPRCACALDRASLSIHQAPEAGTGTISFRTLIKRGPAVALEPRVLCSRPTHHAASLRPLPRMPRCLAHHHIRPWVQFCRAANEGQFYYPATDLVLHEVQPTVDTESSSWHVGERGESCRQTCAKNGLECDATGMQAEAPTNSEELERLFGLLTRTARCSLSKL